MESSKTGGSQGDGGDAIVGSVAGVVTSVGDARGDGDQPTAGQASVLFSALSAFLAHGGSSNLLSMKELGRISITSKSILAASQETFQLLYRQAVQAGASPSGYSVEATRFVWRDETLLHTWSGEGCLLSCFSNPDPAIVVRYGYKRMAGCLRSKLCMKCGSLAATANPLTFQRICDDCSEDDVEGYLILKSRVKSAFLLGEKDLRGIMSVTVPVCIGGRECESTIYLLNDIRLAAYDKWGGADGLASKFDRKNGITVAHARFTRGSEEQRKRQKVEMKAERDAAASSLRPFEDDESLRSWIKQIPSEYILRPLIVY